MAFSRTPPVEWRQHVPEADRLEAARIAAEEAAEERYEEVYDEVREEGDWLTRLGDYALADSENKAEIQAALEDGELRSGSLWSVISKAIRLESEKRTRAEGHNLV